MSSFALVFAEARLIENEVRTERRYRRGEGQFAQAVRRLTIPAGWYEAGAFVRGPHGEGRGFRAWAETAERAEIKAARGLLRLVLQDVERGEWPAKNSSK